MPDVHVTDGLVSELTDVFTAGQARLEGLVRAGLARGLDARRLGTAEQLRGDATQAYRQRQLAQATDIINELKRTAKFAPVAVMHGYRAGLAAVDRTIGSGAAIAGTFGGVHIGAVQVLGGNLEGGLTRAAEHAQRSIEDVFAAASELEGALSPRLARRGLPADFIGRRTNDPFRKAALQVIGSGTVALDTRRQVSAELARRLVRDGTTDAMTGFVDAAGKRWPLATYASMVTRTTTREAVTRGTVNRLGENGLDLVTISSHGSSCEICADYDGNTYSLDGVTPGYEILDDQPPFHPNCGHVLTPADANLTQFERELQAAVDEPVGSPIPAAPAAAAAPVDLEAEAAKAAGQEAALAAASSAQGTAPGGLADVLDAGDIRSRHELGRMAEAIDSVHAIPAGMPRIPYKVATAGLPRSAEGAYTRLRTGGAVDLTVKPGSELPISLHEFGHFLDHKGLSGDIVGMGSELGDAAIPAMRRLLGELEDTPTIRRLREASRTGRVTLPGQTESAALNARGRELIDYLLTPREQFARGYEQYIARRAGVDSTRHVAGAGLEYWPEQEAAKLETAYDALFRELGLLHNDPLAGQVGGLDGLLDPAGPGPGSPFGGPARPRIYDDTADRLAIQRMIEADPGPDPEAFDSLVAELQRNEKRRRRALNAALGPDLKRELGRKWATDQGLLEQFYRGEITRDELEQAAYENAMSEEDKRVGRASRRELNYGLEHRPIPCFSCGRLKARPADVCPYCGDDPVPITPGHTHATPADRARFNADYGYAHVDTGNNYSAKHGYGR